MSKQIEAMRKLGMSEDEIAQVLADDKSIDRGERMEFDLSAEAEKQAKKYANVGTRKTTGEKTERKRKENPTKAAVIAEKKAQKLRKPPFLGGFFVFLTQIC